MDVWLEQQNGNGSWSPAGPNGGVSDQGIVYQPVNTPNPGPSPSYTFTWTFSGGNQLPPNTNWRVFVYVYIYNQGGGSQGDFPIYSATSPVGTGSANDAPRISWSPAGGSLNPTQVQAGQTYTISADAQDDNGNLVAVSINKNGVPFAYAGGGNGYSGNSQNPTSDGVGTVTYTAWATDSYGAQSPTITWTVQVVGKSNQVGVYSTNASFPFYSQNFTPGYYGGSGSGAWQFCVGGYTNWDAGNSSYSGTNLGPSPGNSPGAVWVPSWSPPTPGTYQFWVAKDGDATFNPSGAAGPYTLSVTPAQPVGSFDGVGPNPVVQGQTISGSGWAADAQLGAPLSSVQILVDGGANGSYSASLGGYRPDVQSANTTWGRWSPRDITYSGWSFSFNTAGLSQGGHTLTAVAYDNAYGVSSTIGSQSFTVSAPIGQTVSITPASAAIYPGQAVTFTANGGANGYVWGGSASGGGNSQTVTFPSAGAYSVTVYSPAGNGYSQSNTAVATITVTTLGQTVSIAPPSAAIYAGQSVTFTASGGNTGYVWGGSASGSGNSQTVTFPTPGTFTVTVYASASGPYAQSNLATASITVNPAGQMVAISPQTPSVAAGGNIQFTASGGQNGYVWGGAATGTGSTNTVTFPNVGTYSVTVYSPAGGIYAQSNTAVATVTVTLAGQMVAIAPTNPSVSAGGSITFTASGGQEGYVWGGAASGGGNSKTVTFPAPGSYNVTVYSPAGGNYSQSNTAVATVTVNANPQTLSLLPASATVAAGSSVTFNASGGQEGYVWGGAASGSGSSNAVTFPNVGVYNVTVYSPAGGAYAQSNTAVATVTVNPDSQVVTVAPASATVTAGNSVTFTASGGQEGYVWGGVASGNGGMNSVPFPNAGTFAVTVYSPAGGVFAQSNMAVASVTVLNPTYTLTVNAGAGGTASGSTTGLAGNATPPISATPNSGYTFVAWTGDTPANPTAASTTIAMNNANRTVTANFAALQVQTITFNPPATALYPGPAIVLTATASSGLPVSFSVLSGLATLVRSTLTFTGLGTVTVQASQGGGVNNGVYYQAAPSVSRPIQVNAPFTIIRLRFNSPAIVNGVPTGNTTLDAQNIGHSAAGKGQSSFIWTDPTGLQNSPWPTFNNPVHITPSGGSVSLPSAPVVTPTRANSVPTRQLTGSP